ncbi:MAG: hypothetical protein NVS3B12_14220 [Acidimicrobiales bacterium]
MKTIRIRLGASALIVPLLAVGACGSSSKAASTSGTAAPGATSAPVVQELVVHAGINDPTDKHIAVNAFMPAEIAVHVGTSVTWSWDGTIEPHSVSFYAGDGRPAPGPPNAKDFAPAPPRDPSTEPTQRAPASNPSGRSRRSPSR